MSKTVYLASSYGFSTQQRAVLLPALVHALESLGVQAWEPFQNSDLADRETLNLMLFTGFPAAGWEDYFYRSIDEIASPRKALARWLREP